MNLLIVFFLTGIWHGASWNFLIWGMTHGAFMLLERIGKVERFMKRLPSIVRTVYVLLVVIPAWAFFRIETFGDGFSMAGHLFAPFFPSPHRPDMFVGYYLDPWFLMIFLGGILFSVIRWEKIKVRLKSIRSGTLFYGMETVYWILLLWFSLAAVISKTYSPFIYFRF
jgi:alginate O-acetyltransferase complex protein AlgI